MRQELLQPGKVIPEMMTLKEFNELIQTSDEFAKSYPIYKTIIRAIESKYSWLGRQTAEELLDSIAMSVIDRCYNLPFRSNQHVLLIWDSGWFKSSILSDFLSLMPAHYFGGIGKITDAALRGTVETGAKLGHRFVAPTVLNNDFLIVREFGAGMSEDIDLKQTLLTVLEDQIVCVSLAKFAQLDEIERKAASAFYASNHFEWEGSNTFRYKTKVTLWCANYTPVEDPALLNRFNIVNPERVLDETLRNWVMMHPYMDLRLEPGIAPPFKDINEAVDAMMGANRPPLPVALDLREELKGIKGLGPRAHSNIIKKILAAAWWGFWYDSDTVRGKALNEMMAKSESLKGKDEDIIDKLKSGWYTIGDVAAELGISYGAVWKVLNQLKDRPYVVLRKKDPKDKRTVYLRLAENTQSMSTQQKQELVDLTVSKIEFEGEAKKESGKDGEEKK